jgi:hypothetical protein
VLRAIVNYYAPDSRILAVVVFGALGLGTWDRYSDLDLDIILADGVSVAARGDAEALCRSLRNLYVDAADRPTPR